MISSHWNSDTAASRFVTSRPSAFDEIDKTIPSCSVPSDPESVVEHKNLGPNPHHRVSQILFLFGRRNEMWVRVRLQPAGPVDLADRRRLARGVGIRPDDHGAALQGTVFDMPAPVVAT